MPSPGTAERLDHEGFAVPAAARRVWDFSADGVRRSLDASLKRLGVDRVDIVYLHDPDDHWLEASGSGIAALVALREQGVIDAIGVGMNQSSMPAEFVRRHDVDLVMLAGRYTLLDQSALDDLLPVAVERDVRIAAAGIYNSGLLSGPRPVDGASSTTSLRRWSWSTGRGGLRRSVRPTASTCPPLRFTSRSGTQRSHQWSSVPVPPIRSAPTSSGSRGPYPMTCGPSSSPPDWSAPGTECAHDDDHRGPCARRPVPHLVASRWVRRHEQGCGLLGGIRRSRDRRTGLGGHGFTFTIGRGNDIVTETVRQRALPLVGRDLDELCRDPGSVYRELAEDSQLRWLGPEKGSCISLWPR